MKSRKNNSKSLFFGIGALGLLTLLLSSCLRDTSPDTAPPSGILSFIQASPDEPPINFFLNGVRINGNSLNYGDNLDYFRAYAGNRDVNIYDQQMNLILSAPVTIAANTVYSVFLANVATKPEILLLTDTLNKPSAGNASIRLVDVSPDAPAVDLAIKGGAVLASHKSYKGFSSFVPVTGNTNYTLEIRNSGTSTVLATLTNVNLVTGYVYTFWFHGLSSTSTAADHLSAGLITNAYFL